MRLIGDRLVALQGAERGLLALAVAGALGYLALMIASPSGATSEPAYLLLYNPVLLVCAGVCFVRGRRAAQRRRAAYVAFGLGLSSWALGNMYWAGAFSDAAKIPYPSPADVGFLLALPAFFTGVAMLIRDRIGRFTLADWLDGLMSGIALAAVGATLLAPALVGLTDGDLATVATNLAYPLGDLLLLAFIGGALAVGGRRGSEQLLTVAAGLIVWSSADIVYLYSEAAAIEVGAWMDALWLAGGLLIAVGACVVSSAPSLEGQSRRSPHYFLIAATLPAIAILITDHFNRLHEASIWLAGATLVAAALRLVVSFRENDRLLEQLRDDSITDALTGLGNRRRLVAELDACNRVPDEERYVFALFDLDGFKAYNDSFGHPAGDALLRRVAGKLAVAVGQDCAYRPGGDEFCVLVRGDAADAPAIVEGTRAALSERGEGFAIGASCGWVLVPAEAETASTILGLADQRMYADKGKRGSRADRQTHDVLLSMLREREPELIDHGADVAGLATRLGRRLRLDGEQLDVLCRAAELHDVGKLAVPDSVLSKPGPLDESEWEMIRRHTLVGERVLRAAPALVPVARLVRSAHERWDGRGYPDGLAGEDIPAGSRIIFLCDAFAAMTSDRPYRPRLSRQQAIDELRRNAGTQFDPALVEPFIEMLRAEAPEPVAAPPSQLLG